MATRTRLQSRSRMKDVGRRLEDEGGRKNSSIFNLIPSASLRVVSPCFTELLNTSRRTKKVQATIHEYAKGAQNPLATHFFMRLIVLIAIFATIPAVSASPLWTAEIWWDNLALWLTPQSDKALKAADLAIERLQETKNREEDAQTGIRQVQHLLNTIEENLNIQGKPYKVLRKLQDLDDKLRTIQTTLQQQKGSQEYQLVIKHATLRTDILIQEVELAKQKTKAKLE